MKTIGMVAMCAFIVMMFGIVPSANAAGFGIPNSGNSLGGNFRWGNYLNGPNYGSSTYSNNGSESGSFNLRLDPTKYSFESGNWSFYSYEWDPSRWNATAYLHGYRDVSENEQQQGWSQQVQQGGVKLDASLNFAHRTEKSYDGIVYEYMDLTGGLSISPAHITSSYLSFNEGFDSWYTYPNGYDKEPVITQIPSWTLTYNLWGDFVAPTYQGAQAMGAQFVPEPATMAILAIGGIMALKRRRR